MEATKTKQPKTQDYQIQRIHDRNLLRAFLSQNRGLNAYALGDLEDGMWEVSEFSGAFVDETLEGVLLFWKGMKTPVCILAGTAQAAEVLLHQAERPEKVMAIHPADLFSIFENYYQPTEVERLWRMVVTPTEFVDGPSNPRLRRLVGADADKMTRLLSLERGMFGRSTTYSADQLESGIFFGIEDKENQLIAAAGTHICAFKERVGAVGHVFTAPTERGRGYATSVTGAVTRELFRQGIDLVALNVVQNNSPAVRAYQKLGYRIHAPIAECIAIKR